MIPGRWDLECQPGATFEARIVLMLDENYEPVDISSMTPMAKVRLSATGPVILDLEPELITPGVVASTASATADSRVITCNSHGLYVGTSITFSGVLPRPLRTNERYIVVYKNYSLHTFSVISFRAALQDQTTPVRMETASASFTVTKVPGQMLIPEKTDETTNALSDADAKWDLMLEDASGRRLAPLAKGAFPIKRGMTP